MAECASMRLRVPRRSAWPLIALSVALAGCGGGSAASTVQPVQPSQPPARILASVRAALGQVHSFHIDGRTIQSGQPATISGDIQVPGRLRVTLHQTQGVAQIIVIGADVYLNANAAYYAAQGSPATVAGRIANRWVKLPPGGTSGIGTLLAATEPSTIGHCVVATHLGTISVKGRGTVNGQAVIILADKGDAPGSTPGLLYVAASGPPLPLREVQTGRQAPGGTPDAVCHETQTDVSGATTANVVNLSEYNSARAVTAPAGAVDLATLAGSSTV